MSKRLISVVILSLLGLTFLHVANIQAVDNTIFTNSLTRQILYGGLLVAALFALSYISHIFMFGILVKPQTAEYMEHQGKRYEKKLRKLHILIVISMVIGVYAVFASISDFILPQTFGYTFRYSIYEKTFPGGLEVPFFFNRNFSTLFFIFYAGLTAAAACNLFLFKDPVALELARQKEMDAESLQ